MRMMTKSYPSKVILVDMDSILSDFLQGILDMHKAETGETLTQDEVGAWDYKFSNGNDCYYYFSQPGFFRNLAPIPGAREGLKRLRDAGHETLIVSSATLTNAPTEKFLWLEEHLPEMPRKNVIFCARKGFVRGDILIDDYPVNAEDFKASHPHGSAYTLKYTYNADCGLYTLRADTWREITDHILQGDKNE